MSSYEYNSSYDPPAPFVEITVSRRGEVTLFALVDSGADATMIPASILSQVGARYVDSRRIRGVVGAPETVDLYLVKILIGEQLLHGIHAIAVTQGMEAIVGRDVLNQLVVKLDGINGLTEVS